MITEPTDVPAPHVHEVTDVVLQCCWGVATKLWQTYVVRQPYLEKWRQTVL